jgi:hypothetical protein
VEKQGYKLIKGATTPYLMSPNVGYTRPCTHEKWNQKMEQIRVKLKCRSCGVLCTNSDNEEAKYDN